MFLLLLSHFDLHINCFTKKNVNDSKCIPQQVLEFYAVSERVFNPLYC